MQAEQIGIVISTVFLICLGFWWGWLTRGYLKPPSPQPDNKSYQTKKQKAEVSQHVYNEVVTLTDKKNSDLVKEIEDQEAG